jgi:hypothetical protein
MSDLSDSMTVPAWYEGYLWLPRHEAPEAFEDFLRRWAGPGYLVLSVAEDAAPHGDAQFLQTRRAPRNPQAPALYWQQHAALHTQLCSMGLQHMPIGLGPGPGEPFALAWLLPAPTRGKLLARTGFEQQVDLTEEQRDSWLDWVARQLNTTSLKPAQRVLLQPPGGRGPACWHYGSYRGDVPIDGPYTQRLRTLLEALPRYACDFSTPPVAATADQATGWPLLLNQRPGGTIEGMRRGQVHQELFSISLPEQEEAYWLSTKPGGASKLVFSPQPKPSG